MQRTTGILAALATYFSNIESWDIKFIKVVTWNKIPMSHKVTFKRIPHISGASLSGSAGECWRFHTDVSDEVPSLRRSLLSLSSLEQTVINSCQGLQSLLWASEHIPKLSMTESGDKITQSYTRMRRADLRLHPLIFQTSGIIWWLGLFGYYGASLGSGLIFSSSGSFDYGELIFSSMGGDCRSDRSHLFGLAGLGNHHPAMVLLGQHLGLPCCPHCTCLEGTSSAAGCPSLHFARWKYGCKFQWLGFWHPQHFQHTCGARRIAFSILRALLDRSVPRCGLEQRH